MRIVSVLLLTIQIIFGQNQGDRLFELYQNHEFNQLSGSFIELSTAQKLNSEELLLFESLLSEDGQKSFAGMMKLTKSAEPRIRKIALEKIKDYYFARGYYQTASEYEIEMIGISDESAPPVIQPELSGSVFHIQVGAYGFRENAERLQKMLETQNIRADIVTRSQNSKTLFCVWINGKESLEATMEFAQTLTEKYDLSYHIIKE